MSLRRYAAKRDASEGPIVDALRRCGFSVERWSAKDCPDLIVGRNQITRVIEVKTGKAQLEPGQEDWWAGWRGNGRIVLRDAALVPVLVRYWTRPDAELLRGLQICGEKAVEGKAKVGQNRRDSPCVSPPGEALTDHHAQLGGAAAMATPDLTAPDHPSDSEAQAQAPS